MLEVTVGAVIVSKPEIESINTHEVTSYSGMALTL